MNLGLADSILRGLVDESVLFVTLGPKRIMDEVFTWRGAPETLSLATGEVHVWRLALDQSESVLTEFRRTLDADEIERAGRFHFEKHQRHFVAGRGGLRYVLSRYLDVKPEELRFSYGAFGKPALIGEELRFNMSHSHGLALFAVSADRELGVDVEHVRADFASEDIARRFFSTVEVAAFNALPKAEQVAAFFRCWTRKEAYIKAIGRGLSEPLDAFDVTLAPGDMAALLRAAGADVSRWAMFDLDPGEDYAGALLVETPVSRIRLWEMSLAAD
jgi:4'-phosphopantetheinyl transferase